MAKSMSKDSQIILNMMRVQNSINSVLGDVDKDSEIIKDKTKVELLTYYILKMFALRKNVSGKTKKALTMFNDFKGATILNSLSFCYPMISDIEIVRVARSMADEDARADLLSRYDICIKESQKYSGE